MDDQATSSRSLQAVELAPGTDELLHARLALLEQVSRAADDAARRDLFGRHLVGRSPNMIRMYRAAFAALRTVLAGIDERLDVSLAEEPRLWQVVSFGLVEASRRWLLARGYAIKSVNDYMGVVKTYAALAQQAGLMDAETLLGASPGSPGSVPPTSIRSAPAKSKPRAEGTRSQKQSTLKRSAELTWSISSPPLI